MKPETYAYDLESLRAINPSYDREYGVQQRDVNMVNEWKRVIEQSRSQTIPRPGDRVIFTDRHGNYYPNAIIEKHRQEDVQICERPSVPFVYHASSGIKVDISGGAFCGVPADKLKYLGSTECQFKDWGWCGACGNGSVHFNAKVSLWEFAEPDPLYGEFTTKDWNKIYITHIPGPDPADGYRFCGDGVAFKTEEEFIRFCTERNATVFPGNWHNQLVVWAYRKQSQSIPLQDWERLDCPESELRTHNGRRTKYEFDHQAHTVTFYSPLEIQK